MMSDSTIYWSAVVSSTVCTMVSCYLIYTLYTSQSSGTNGVKATPQSPGTVDSKDVSGTQFVPTNMKICKSSSQCPDGVKRGTQAPLLGKAVK